MITGHYSQVDQSATREAERLKAVHEARVKIVPAG